MTVLVTGGAGFIGSHTAVSLLEAGMDVILVDNFSNSSPKVLHSIETITGEKPIFYELDICDEAKLSSVFAAHSVDAVIHFAGLKAVGESVSMPLEYYRNNLIGTLSLCSCMRKAGVKKLVFSSSATVYGMDNPVPFTEEMSTSATNPYGYTKVMIEQMLKDLSFADAEWSIVLLRYFNPIGAHKSGLIGERPAGVPNNIFPYISQVAGGILPELSIFGDDYDTIDGTGVRDYIHVCDLAEGHLSALQWTADHKGCEAINLGTGKGTSVYQLIHAFEVATGTLINFCVAPRRPGDLGTAYAATDKAKTVLGWTAKRDLREMCADGWNFTKHSFGL